MATEGDYLKRVLAEQDLADDSSELKELRRHRDEVEKLLRNRFGSAPRIRYGGSKAKGTMNKESYDLDITCYFPRDDDSAGSTLAEIYTTVEEVLRSQYWTESKGSAIRLRSRDDYRADFHIDVVPGRFVEGDAGDVHLYGTTGEKKYLKTNLDIHIGHVKDSGVVPAIRLFKLWAARNNVGIKTFALELLTIDLLKGRKSRPMADQLEHVLKGCRDSSEDLSIEDPANPHGNDLSELLNRAVRADLQDIARRTLEQVDGAGWEAVFGPVDNKATDVAALRRMAAVATVRPKPYAAN